jgi:hypothetical protein
MSAEKPPQQSSPRQRRRMVTITGGVLIAFSVYLLIFLVPDFLSAAAGPDTMTLAEAAAIATEGDLDTASTYVHIADGEWQCDTIDYVRGPSSTNRLTTVTRFTEIFLTDTAKPPQTAMLVSMSGEMACEDFAGLEPTGYLTRMSSSQRQALTNAAQLARFFDAQDFLKLCGYCGEENSFIGLIFGVVFALAGVGVVILGRRMPGGN